MVLNFCSDMQTTGSEFGIISMNPWPNLPGVKLLVVVVVVV